MYGQTQACYRFLLDQYLIVLRKMREEGFCAMVFPMGMKAMALGLALGTAGVTTQANALDWDSDGNGVAGGDNNGGDIDNWFGGATWFNGAVSAAWVDGSGANFTGARDRVTINGATAVVDTAGFNVPDYVVNASGGGLLSVSTVNVISGQAFISAPLTGAGTFSKTGAGSLVLTGGTSGFSRDVILAGGILNIDNSVFSTSGSITTLASTTFFLGVGVGAPHNATLTADGLIATGGHLSIGSDAQINANGGWSNSGVVDSLGDINVVGLLDSSNGFVVNGGTLDTTTLNNSSNLSLMLGATLTVTGTAANTATGILQVGNGGAVPVVMTVGGLLTNDGRLNVSITDGRLNADAGLINNSVVNAAGDVNIIGVLDNNLGADYEVREGTTDADSLTNAGSINGSGGIMTIAGTIMNEASGIISLGGGILNANGLVTNDGLVAVGVEGHLNANAGLTNNLTLSSLGDVNVTGVLDNSATGSFTMRTGTVDATALTNSGLFTAQDGVATITGAATNEGGGSLIIGDTLGAIDSAIFTVGTNLTTIAGSTMLVQRDGFLDITNNFINGGTTTVNDGNVDVGNNTTNSGTLTINNNGTLDTTNFTNSGTTNVQSGGNLNVALSSTNTVTGIINVDNAIFQTTLVLTNRGVINVTNGGTVDPILIDNFGAININNGLVEAQATIDNHATGVITVGDGAGVADATLRSLGALRNDGAVIVDTDGVVEVTGGFTNNLTVTTSGDIDVGGVLDNNAAGVFTQNAGTVDAATLTNAGAITQATGATMTLQAGGTNEATGIMNIAGEFLALSSFNNLNDLNVNAGGSFSTGASLGNAGTLIVTDAEVDVATTLFNQGSATFNGASSLHASNVQNDGTGTLTINGTTDVEVTGTLANDGQITQTGGTLTTNLLSNAGDIDIEDGTFNTTGLAINEVGATLVVGDGAGSTGVWNASGGVSNAGAIVANDAGTINLSSNNTGAGSIAINDNATLNVSNGADVANTLATTALGVVNVLQGDSAFTGAITNAGTFNVGDNSAAAGSGTDIARIQGGIANGNAINVLGDGLLALTSDVTGAGTLAVNAGGQVETSNGADIANAINNSGTVTHVNGTSTYSGVVTNNGTLAVGDGNGGVGSATLSLTEAGGFANAGTVQVNADGRLLATAGLTNNSTVTSVGDLAVTGALTNTNTLNINGGTASADSIANNGTANFNGGATTSGALTNTVTVNLGAGVDAAQLNTNGLLTNTSGNFNIGGGGGAIDSAQLNANAGLTNAANLNLNGTDADVNISGGALTNSGTVTVTAGSWMPRRLITPTPLTPTAAQSPPLAWWTTPAPGRGHWRNQCLVHRWRSADHQRHSDCR